MDWIINLYAKSQGVTVWLMDVLPLLGAMGSILGIVGGILARAAGAQDPAGVFHAIHPTTPEMAGLSLSFAVLRAHFKHNDNVKAIAEAQGVPLPNQP